MSNFFQDQEFKSALDLVQGEYENCVFTDINLSGFDFSGFKFSECSFINCDLSLIKLSETALRQIIFKDCKMMGVHFDECNDFGLSFNFENCNMSHSSFYQKDIRKTMFNRCNLNEVEFEESNLSSAIFKDCDLLNANFFNTNLENADFKEAFNYSLDLDQNKIKNAKFSTNGLGGLLNKYTIIIH